jgi:hypothetical protein
MSSLKGLCDVMSLCHCNPFLSTRMSFGKVSQVVEAIVDPPETEANAVILLLELEPSGGCFENRISSRRVIRLCCHPVKKLGSLLTFVSRDMTNDYVTTI